MDTIHEKSAQYVGLDVHKKTLVLGVAEFGRSPAKSFGTLPHDVNLLIKKLEQIRGTGSLVCCYEAGPTGYGLYRALRKAGFDCYVIAPSLIPMKRGDRVKTDRRDACKLAHFLRSGDLTMVCVPDEDDEAMRDLSRTRLIAKKAQMVARHHISKFLLRRSMVEPEGKRWTKRYNDWLTTVKFSHKVHQCVWDDYVHAMQETTSRVQGLNDAIEQHVATWKRAPLVTALQALRGVQLTSAFAIVAEVGDFKRFSKPTKLMGYTGMVPSEYSSGDEVRRGSITRSGNTHLRRILTECAWSYRFKASESKTIRMRVERVSPQVRSIAWKAQIRLHQRYEHLMVRGKNPNKVVTSIARELVGFIWSIAAQEQLLAQA